MSYEGFDQVLCKNGHYHEIDSHEFKFYSKDNNDDAWGDLFVCECGELAVWWNSVDQTNACDRLCDFTEDEKDDCREIGCRFIVLEEIPTKRTLCPTCGHCIDMEMPKYKIPTNWGHLVNQEASCQKGTEHCGKD
jgi:hypothetical protein